MTRFIEYYDDNNGKKKYLGINLIKKMKNLYTENYKTLMKEIEDDVNNGKIFCAHGLEELIL